MSNYSTSLKSWGSTGSEWPDNYYYAEGEAPVDAWDNFLTNNTIKDIEHLVSLTNSRLESDYGTDANAPSSPEDGHLYWDTDNDQLEVYDGTAGAWKDLAWGQDLRAHETDTTNPHSVSLEKARTVNNTMSGVVEFGDQGSDPVADGEITQNAGDVKIHSGGAVRNISNISGSKFHGDWLHAVDDLGMDPTGTNAVDTIWNNNVADNTTIYFPDGTFLFEEGHLHNSLTNFRVVGEDKTKFLIDDTFSAEPTTTWRYLFIFGQNGTNSCTNIQVENIEIDMTTASAGAGSFWCHLDGEHNLVRNVDVNGFRDDSIGGSDGEMVMRFDVIGTQSYGKVERFRALDGGENQGLGDPFTGLYVGGATTGTVLLQACAMAGWEDNAIYTSAAGGSGGGNVHIKDCYAADTGIAGIRPGGLNTLVEGCYVEQTDSTKTNPRGYYVRDGNTTMKRCYGSRSGGVNDQIIEIIGTTSGGSAAKHTVIEDSLFEADGGTGSLGYIDADSDHPRRLQGCKFTATGDPGSLTAVLSVDSADVDLIDCEVDAYPNAANYWYGVSVTAPDCHIKGGMYKSDRRGIWFRTGANNSIAEDVVAEAVSFSENSIEVDADDVWVRGKESDITLGMDWNGARGVMNNIYFDSGPGSPTASDYEPGMVVEWDDTDGATANDGLYIVSRDGSTMTGVLDTGGDTMAGNLGMGANAINFGVDADGIRFGSLSTGPTVDGISWPIGNGTVRPGLHASGSGEIHATDDEDNNTRLTNKAGSGKVVVVSDGEYDIQKNGVDGANVINFKT